MNRDPNHRKPEGIDDAFAIEPFKPAGSSKTFFIPPAIQSDFDAYLMDDVPHHNYTFELLRDWYTKNDETYESEFIRAMLFAINWKSKVGNTDANSNFRVSLQVDIRKGDIIVREDGSMALPT